MLASSTLLLTACGPDDNQSSGPPTANTPPTANAGSDVSVSSGTTVTLSAAGSSDSDGSISAYEWYQDAGDNTQVTISNANTATPSFTATVYADTVFSFHLTVRDDDGEASQDTVLITVTPDRISATLDTPWAITKKEFGRDKVIYTGSKYVSASYFGMSESTNGTNWSSIDFGYHISTGDVAANGNNIVALPINSRFTGVIMTTDGTNWQTVDLSSNVNCNIFGSISYDGTQFVANSGKNVCSSVDGSSWQLQSTQPVNFTKIIPGGGKYAVILSDGLYTIDTLSSTAMNVSSSAGLLSDLVFGGSTFIGLRRSGELAYSSDAINWTNVSSIDIPANVTSISYSSSKGFTANTGNVIYTSTDGMSWSVVGGSNLAALTCSGCKVVNGINETLFLSGTKVYSSADQTTWSLVSDSSGDPNVPTSSQFSVNNVFYGLNSSGALVQSNDEISWTVVSNSTVGQISTVIHDGAQFVAHAYSGGSSAPGMYYSADGISWTKAITFGSNYVYGASVTVGPTTYNFVTSSDAIEDRNKILFSDDGISYQTDDGLNAISPRIDTANVKQAVTDGAIIVAISTNGIYSNASGSWATVASATNLKDVVWTGTNFVAAAQSGVIMTSPDGITWTTQTWLNSTGTISDILVVGATVYATDSVGNIATSADHGVTWVLSKDFRAASSITNNTITELAYDGTTVYGFGYNSDLANVTTVKTADAGTNWSTDVILGTAVNGHVIYDATGTRFVSSTKKESTSEITGAITWAATTTLLPNDPSFAYIATQEALAGISLSRVHYVSGTTNSYTSGNAGYSVDGQNWVIKTGLTAYHFIDYTPISGIFAKLNSAREIETSTDGINYTAATVTGLVSGNTNFNFIKYVNNQYIGINLDSKTGHPGIYTSSNGSDWALISEADLGISLYVNDYDYKVTYIQNIVYDGSQYHLLFTHKDLTDNGYNEGIMMLTSTDLQNFTLHKTGIYENIYQNQHTLAIVNNEYKLDNFYFTATHAYY